MFSRGEHAGVTEDTPEKPPMLALLERCGLWRNAKVGLAVGAAVALAAYLFRALELLGPLGPTRQYPVVGPDAWFLLLAFVLAVTFGMLVTAALTVRTAVKETRQLSR